MINISTIQITPELLTLIAEVDEFKGAWRALGILAPDRLHALRRVATIESVGSSTRIEGSKLSDREVERLLANLEIKAFSTRDEQEVAGFAEVMETIFRAWPDIKLTENHIRQLHPHGAPSAAGRPPLDLRHSTKVEQLEAALRTLGRSVPVEFKTAA